MMAEVDEHDEEDSFIDINDPINDDRRDPTPLNEAENAVKILLESLKKAEREDVIKNKGYMTNVMQMQIRARFLLETWDERNGILVPPNREHNDLYKAITRLVEEMNEYTSMGFVSDVKSIFRWKSTIQMKLSEFCNVLACYEGDLRMSLKRERERLQVEQQRQRGDEEIGLIAKKEDQIRKLTDEVETNRKKIQEYEEQIKQYEEDKKLHQLQITALQNRIGQFEKKNKESEKQIQKLQRQLVENRQGMEEQLRAESAKTNEKMKQLEDKIAQVERMLNQAHPSM